MKYAALLPFLLCTGCFTVDLDDLAREPPAKRRYLLDVSIPKRAKAPSGSAILLVERAYAAAPYNGRPLVFRVGDTEHRTDFFHEFLVPPADQVTEITRSWLRAQSRYPRVIHADADALATATLTIDLTELRGDVRDPAQPKAALAIRVTLTRPGETNAEVVLQREYRAEVACADASPQAMVQGFSEGLTEVLRALTADLPPTP